MQIARKLSFFAGVLFAGILAAHAQIASVHNVDTVASIAETPAGYSTITGSDNSAYTYIFATGYFQPQDGGGGYFSKEGNHSCSFTQGGGSVTMGSKEVVFSPAVTTAITRGMGISSGTALPAGDTVDSFHSLGAATIVWLSYAATSSVTNGSFVLDGGGLGVDGGTR